MVESWLKWSCIPRLEIESLPVCTLVDQDPGWAVKAAGIQVRWVRPGRPGMPHIRTRQQERRPRTRERPYVSAPSAWNVA
jgi:hypothetical protein